MPKLLFKGEKKRKKERKIKVKERKEIEWAELLDASDFSGYFCIYHNKELINYNPVQQALTKKPVINDNTPLELENAIPYAGSQVFHCVRLNEKIYIKTSTEKYWTGGKFSVGKDACGELESWTLEYDDGWMFKDYLGNYLSFNDFTLSQDKSAAKVEIKVQRLQKEEVRFVGSAELETNSLFQAHSKAHKDISKLSVKGITAARKAGKINEHMVLKRQVFKGDKFCW